MLLFSFMLFFIGLFIGSFLLVVIDRLLQNKSALRGRSVCEYCSHLLSPLDLLPLVSYVFLRGKCRYCHHTLSRRYPAFELLTGCLYAAIPFLLGFTQGMLPMHLDQVMLLLITLYSVSVFLLLFVIDIKFGIIPFAIVLPATIITFVYQLIFRTDSLLNVLLTALIAGGAFLLLHIVTKGRGMGFGDVVLVCYLGLLLGFPSIVPALYIAFLTGAGVSLILILVGRKKMKGGTIPFGPFLVSGAFIAYFFGERLITLFYQFMLL